MYSVELSLTQVNVDDYRSLIYGELFRIRSDLREIVLYYGSITKVHQARLNFKGPQLSRWKKLLQITLEHLKLSIREAN